MNIFIVCRLCARHCARGSMVSPALMELCQPVGKTDMIRQVIQIDHENGDRGYEGSAPGGLGLDLLGAKQGSGFP